MVNIKKLSPKEVLFSASLSIDQSMYKANPTQAAPVVKNSSPANAG